jgi:glycosyltransferase involved in cell wall biosynthesis
MADNIFSKDQLPFVSVIIPILNEVNYIEACLQSVFQQEYPSDKVEVLVLDGGSTDGTLDKVKKLINDSSGQVRLIHNPGKTQVKAFNLGVKEGKGDIFIRLDAHAGYQSNYILKCVETLARTGAANAGGWCTTQPSGKSLLAKAIALVCQMRFGIGGAKFRVGGKAGPVDTVPFGAFPRETFEKVGLMNEVLVRGEDNEFNSRIRSAGLMVYFNPEISCTYYARKTVAAFMKQLYANGLYHILTLKVNRCGCSVRHFIPFFFVMTLLFCAVLGFASTVFWKLGGVVLGFYLFVDLLASLGTAKKHGFVYLLILPWLLGLAHITYGAGTLCGMFKFGFSKVKAS